MTEYVNAPQLI